MDARGTKREMMDDHHQIIGNQVVDPRHLVQDQQDLTNEHAQVENWAHPGIMSNSEDVKRIVLEIHRHMLSEYHRSRQKLLIEVTEKLHEEFLAEEEKTRGELVQQFKEELESTKEELDKKYRESLKYELAQLEERHRKEMMNVKRQQWCYQCEKEAIYPCCWNTAYCGVDCQQQHWPQHKKYCKRKKGGAR
ncbi:unnamed protein product [Auanema sp. JU1783]|nr:unnamed protein product [Auanema sp. JU1783]